MRDLVSEDDVAFLAKEASCLAMNPVAEMMLCMSAPKRRILYGQLPRRFEAEVTSWDLRLDKLFNEPSACSVHVRGR